MKKVRKNTAKTRNLLLKAGYQLFCEKGFRDATVADICTAAGTNVASVNYHFGDKETLYREAWLNAFEETVKKYPIDGGVPENASPEERLRGFIRSLMHRIMSEPSDMSIMHMEMSNPTGLLSELMAEKIKVQFDDGKKIIKSLLGENATEQQIHYCHTSILGQCFHLGASRKSNKKRFRPPDLIEDVGSYCDHVVKFSLAGISALKKEIEKSGSNKENKRGNI